MEQTEKILVQSSVGKTTLPSSLEILQDIIKAQELLINNQRITIDVLRLRLSKLEDTMKKLEDKSFIESDMETLYKCINSIPDDKIRLKDRNALCNIVGGK